MTIAERNRAYEKAISLVAEVGLEQASASKLMARMCVSHFTFYNVFLSRSELFSACFDYIDRNFSSVFDTFDPREGEPMRDFFYRILGDLYDYIMEHKAHNVFYSTYGDSLGKHVDMNERAFMKAARRAAIRAHEFYRIETNMVGELLWLHALSSTFVLTKCVIAKTIPETKETRQAILALILDGLFAGMNAREN